MVLTRSPRGQLVRHAGRASLMALVAWGAAALPVSIAAATPPTPFYVVPDPLPPGAPGEIIKTEPAGETASIKTIRVMYHSRSLPGNDIAVTGLVHIPKLVPAPPGGRNVVTSGHGTTGTADQCAPSITNGFHRYFGEYLDLGYVVVETDYEGLGTPGIHPHLVGDSEARGMIDIVRAARNLPEAEAGTRYAATGISQGGHAVLFVGEIAATWAPELQLVGVNSEAPGTELPLAARFLSKLPDADSSAAVMMTALGINSSYPQADLAQVMTPLGLSLTPLADQLCTDALGTALAAQGGGPALYPNIEPPEPWASLFVAIDPGHRPTPVPIRIFQGGMDPIVLPPLTVALHDRLCGLGDDVARNLYPAEGHGASSPESQGEAIQFVIDRFAGLPYAGDCPPPPVVPPTTTPTTPVVVEPAFTG